MIGISEETAIQTVHTVAHRQIAESQKKSSLSLWKPAIDLYGGYYLYTLRERDYLERETGMIPPSA